MCQSSVTRCCLREMTLPTKKPPIRSAYLLAPMDVKAAAAANPPPAANPAAGARSVPAVPAPLAPFDYAVPVAPEMGRYSPVYAVGVMPAAPAPTQETVVEVRPVWAYNFESEMWLIQSVMHNFPFVAVDAEFPGTVYRPEEPHFLLSALKRYALMKSNVDELGLIQLGFTLCDAAGRLPDLGTSGAVSYVWEFNFRDFDICRDRYAPESIALLQSKGLDFDRLRRDGVDSAAFGAKLWELLMRGLAGGGWITFSGAYDFGYLVKIMLSGYGYRLPSTPDTFAGLVALIFGRRVFDVKEMARRCPVELRGGLERVAAVLNVRRAVGERHQAGSDSLLTCQTFMEITRRRFLEEGVLAKLGGVLDGLAAN